MQNQKNIKEFALANAGCIKISKNNGKLEIKVICTGGSDSSKYGFLIETTILYDIINNYEDFKKAFQKLKDNHIIYVARHAEALHNKTYAPIRSKDSPLIPYGFMTTEKHLIPALKKDINKENIKNLSLITSNLHRAKTTGLYVINRLLPDNSQLPE